MKHVGAVHVLQSAQQLIQEELIVFVRQIIVRLDDLMQIRLHELEHDEHVVKIPRIRRQHDVQHLHDVRVLQVSQQRHLSQDPRRVARVIERVLHLLYRHSLPRLAIDRRAHDAVASLPDDLLELVPIRLARRVAQRREEFARVRRFIRRRRVASRVRRARVAHRVGSSVAARDATSRGARATDSRAIRRAIE